MKSQSLKPKRNQTGPDEKKTKLEDSYQNALDYFTTFQSSDVNNYVKLNVKNSLTQVDKRAFKHFNDFAKQGKYYMY